MSFQEGIASLNTVAQDYAARFERIDNLVWPKGMRIAVNFTAEFDAMLLRRLHNEPPMQLAKGEFGDRVGVWRPIELFDAHWHQSDLLHAWSHLRALSAPRFKRRLIATASPASFFTPCTWKNPFAMSNPIRYVLALDTDGPPSLVRIITGQLGTAMP